ncbi:3-hydroxyacyl-CoA dehydrogenase NAD-binding domain-containing protein [Elusimicrobiota bacterium]
MGLQTIGIVGAEGLGAGIAQICVQSGLEVLLVDDTEEILGEAEDRILRGLQRAEQPAAFSLMRKATRLDRLESCDLIVEVGSEAPEAKQDLLRRIDSRVPPSTVLAVQTAALPVHIVARAVENPDRVVGVHFFAPAHIAKLVEVVHYEHASENALRTAMDFVGKLGKIGVRCKDKPGFVVNRVARPLYLTAMRLLEKGGGTPATIDAALRNLGGFPAGPFQMVDFFGLENDFAVSEIVYQLLAQPERLKPARVEEKLLAHGCRGYANRRGFYVYGDNLSGAANPLLEELVEGYGGAPATPPEVLEEVLKAVFAEAHVAAGEGIASKEDIDVAMQAGLHWPKGPFAWERERSR